MRISGYVSLRVTDTRTGALKYSWDNKNTITTVATDVLVRMMAPNGATVQAQHQIRSMRFGTSNQAPAITDINLFAEETAVRQNLTDSDRVLVVANPETVTFNATLAAGVGDNIVFKEAGLYTLGTVDDADATLHINAELFARQVFLAPEKAPTDQFDFSWRITYTV